ncbi:hypothetical protein KC8_17905 [Sphingomonas sp. KC8]|nr:hypothetical protein KC8_17905 [Sphingomonas sp. KC8]
MREYQTAFKECNEKAFPRTGRAGRGCRQAGQKVRITPTARACDAIASARLVAASNIFMVSLHRAGRNSPGARCCALHNG